MAILLGFSLHAVTKLSAASSSGIFIMVKRYASELTEIGVERRMYLEIYEPAVNIRQCSKKQATYLTDFGVTLTSLQYATASLFTS